MSVVIDSNTPYATCLSQEMAEDAVYMAADDTLLGPVLAVIYRADLASPKLSVILVGNHGVSGYVNITLDASSRYFGACRGLASGHFASPVRKALAIAALRTYSTMDKPLRRYLLRRALGDLYAEDVSLKYYDEAAAGSLGSRFRLLHGKFPQDIGSRLLESGVLEAKKIGTSVLDVVYEDSDFTIDQNNELVYLLGHQLEQLFDPLSEYSPEPTEKLYAPAVDSLSTLEDDDPRVQEICEELYMFQSHVRQDLLDFLQDFLIPLRVRVLSNEIPDLTIGKLNTVFPPTIDEIYRVNNLFYNALQAALSYGSFEVLKACGTTIPYFYRASMRHEAATRNFSRNLAAYEPSLRQEIEKYSANRIEMIMHAGINLTKTKMLTERLVSSRIWTPEEQPLVDEYYHLAIDTIDSFGRENKTSVAGNYNKRTFTPTGKLLVEIAENWPPELEYDWINRRVVTIFDAVDILEPDSRIRQLHHIVVIFTDAVLILEPKDRIPMTSMSGLHVPSIGDILMHAMLNEAPLDPHIPPLKVIAWAPILDVTFATFESKSLFVFSQPSPFFSSSSQDQPLFSKLYKLVRADHSPDKFVELLAKAKVTTKSQPFHLFKVASKELVLYATVHEVDGYNEEVNRYPISIFLNTPVDESTIRQHRLYGAVSVKFAGDPEFIDIRVLSAMNYHSSAQVPRHEFKDYVTNEISYLLTLSFSSQNQEALPSIVTSNATWTKELLEWSQSAATQHKGHKRANFQHPNYSTDMRQMVLEKPDVSSEQSPRHRKMEKPEASSEQSPRHRKMEKPEVSSEQSPRLRKMENFEVDRRASQKSTRDLAKDPSLGAPASAAASASHSFSDGDSNIIFTFPGKQDSSATTADNSWESISNAMSSGEETEQRDVDAWYNNLSRGDANSLSTSLSEVDESDFSQNLSRNESVYSNTIQLGNFLTRSDSQLYNQHAGQAYAPLDSTPEAAVSRVPSTKDSAPEATVSRVPSTTGSISEGSVSEASADDFSWLAEFVDDGEMHRTRSSKLYPGLRESSLVRLGSYVLSNEQSDRKLGSLLEPPRPGKSSSTRNSYLGSQETTPTLGDLNLDQDSGRGSDVAPLAASASMASFKRLVMSSSLNTLQLASITVQLDQYISMASGESQKVLQQIKVVLREVYNETHRFVNSYDPHANKVNIVKKELESRSQLACMLWLLIRLNYGPLVSPVLELEWQRRSMLVDTLGEDKTKALWRIEG